MSEKDKGAIQTPPCKEAPNLALNPLSRFLPIPPAETFEALTSPAGSGQSGTPTSAPQVKASWTSYSCGSWGEKQVFGVKEASCLESLNNTLLSLAPLARRLQWQLPKCWILVVKINQLLCL